MKKDVILKIPIKKAMLIADYYEFPVAVFLTDYGRLKEMMKGKTRREKLFKYKEMIDRIREIVEGEC